VSKGPTEGVRSGSSTWKGVGIGRGAGRRRLSGHTVGARRIVSTWSMVAYRLVAGSITVRPVAYRDWPPGRVVGRKE
jgi:hypothetical protein